MKAKTRTKKLVSLLLAAIMLLGMIPAASLGVFAEGTDGNLVIDPEATTYTIYGPQDWATVAAASADGNTFAGKTVALGASFGGTESAPMTLATLFSGIFSGEFDGNGNKLSYVTVTGTALIATKTKGVGVSIRNLVVENATLTSAQTNGTAFIVAAVDAGSDDDLTSLINVTVKDSTVVGGEFEEIGALVGRTTGTYYIGLLIDGCKVQNTAITTDATSVGLLIGETVCGVVTIRNTEVSGTVTATTDMNGVGGMIGFVESAGNRYLNLTVTNVDVDAALTTTATAAADFSSTGVMFGLVATGGWTNTQNVGTTAITVDGCTVAGSVNAAAMSIGGIAGIVKVPNKAEYSLIVKNTDIDVDLVNNGADIPAYYLRGVGGVFAMVTGDQMNHTAASAADGNILIENVKIEGDLQPNHAWGHTGGVIGFLLAGNRTQPGFAADITIARCEVLANITEIGTADTGTGMVIGSFGYSGLGGATSKTQHNFTGTYTVTDTLVGGTICNTEGYQYGTGSVFGYVGAYGSTIIVQNSVITTCYTDETDAPRGLVVGRWFTSTANMTVKNCVTNYPGIVGTDISSIVNVNSQGGSNYPCDGRSYNGFDLTGEYTGKYSDDSVCQMSDEQINAMIKRDTNGDILSIGGMVTGGYEQHTATYTVTPAEGAAYTAYAVRFIALSQLEAPANAGIKVVAKDAEGNVVAEFDTLACKAYDSLIAYAPSSETLEAYEATDYGAAKFLAVVIEDIPTGAAYSFEVTPHYETEGGITIYGKTTVAEFDANGNLTNGVN